MKAKVVIPLVIILAGISWLVISNIGTADYFYKVDQLEALGDRAYDREMRVKGRIVAGTIKDKQEPVEFVIEENGKNLKVHYVGTEPLPDMFKDHAETVCAGTLTKDDIFLATQLQAKCASKYEAMAPDAEKGTTEGAPKTNDTI